MALLDGRHALITGGGTGIGAAIAAKLAGAGAAVSLVGRRSGPLEEVAARSAARAKAIVADVTSEARYQRHGGGRAGGARAHRHSSSPMPEPRKARRSPRSISPTGSACSTST